MLGSSIGPISLDERRTTVIRDLGPGKSLRRGIVSYFGGRVLVDYWLHDSLTDRVAYVRTTSAGFHTRTGVHVGTSRRDVR